MSLYDTYETDLEAENEGVYHTFEGGFKLRIARAGGGNVKYLKACADRADQFKSKTRGELAESGIMAEIYAEAIVTDIEDDDNNFVGKDGKAIKLGSEELVQAFRDLPEFFVEAQQYATDRRYFAVLGDGESTAKK